MLSRPHTARHTWHVPSYISLHIPPKNDTMMAPLTYTRAVFLPSFTLSVLTLLAALDWTSISVALPPNFASFSNIFGRKPLVLTALTFFFVGTVVASVAKNFTYMLVGRSIQGVGGGGIIALSEVIVTDIVPLRHRGSYVGILSAMWSIGSVLGPILGGGFAQNVTWRWIFYINFPLIGVGSVFVLLFLRLNFVPSSLMDKIRRVDYVGTILFVGSTASFLIPLSWGGVMYNWDSWHTLVPLIIGAVGFAVFAFYEYFFASDPIIPYSIFQNRTATVSFIGSLLQGVVLWCALYYMPLYYEAVKEYSPVISGVALFPETFTVAPSAGLGLLCILDVNTSIRGWIFLNIVPGIGLCMLFSSLVFAVQASATDENLAIAVAMFSFFRAFESHARKPARISSACALAVEYSKDAAGLVQVIKVMPDGIDKTNLKQAYTVWAVCCGISGVVFLLSLLTQSYDLNRALSTTQGLRSNDRPRDEERTNEAKS
ncbi:putative MFS transporter [Thermoascus aurantiacus ATCC 26904]